MLKRILFAVFLLAQGAMFNTAWGADRDADVQALMKALQFEEQLKELHQQQVAMMDAQGKKMVAQMRQSLPNLDAQAAKEWDAAVHEFQQRVLNSWDPKEAARIYASALTDGLPQKDLKATVAHYQSPEGQRELKVIRAATQSLNAYIMESMRKEMDVALQGYISQVRDIISRQKQRWQAAEAKKK